MGVYPVILAAHEIIHERPESRVVYVFGAVFAGDFMQDSPVVKIAFAFMIEILMIAADIKYAVALDARWLVNLEIKTN